MTFNVRVVSRPEFDSYLTQKKQEEAAALAACGDPTDGVKIAAQNIAFDKPCLAIKKDAAFKIDFDNKDAQAHNVQVYKDEGYTDALTKNEVFAGPAQRTYDDPPLAEGQYFFKCDVHAIMAGKVLVR